ncbi:MAG: type IV pilus secretin PilQ [Deltaproteobacteria bacterium]|nr:type IV pilus secretin PilQ [Deltaproteobacteria bacterium]
METKQMKLWIGLVGVLCGVQAGTAVASPSESVTNTIRGLDVHGEPGQCVVVIEGETKPTFTVFRLQNPLRLVLDIAGADLSRFESPRDVANGVVTQIVLAQYRDHARAFGRVMIGFERDVPYDVKVDGNRLKVVLYATPVDLKKDLAVERAKVVAARKEVADVRALLAVQVKSREVADRQARAALEKAREDERQAVSKLAAAKDAEAERRVTEARERTRLAEVTASKAALNLKATTSELARANRRAAEQAAEAERTRRERDEARSVLLRERREREVSEKERVRREEDLVARLKDLEKRERAVTEATASEIRSTKEELVRLRAAADVERREAALRETKWASRQRDLEKRLVEAAARERALEKARAKELEVRRAAEVAASQLAGRAASLEKREREYGEASKRLAEKDSELEATRRDLRRVMATVEERRRSEDAERTRVRAEVDKLRRALGEQKVDAARVLELKRQVTHAETLRLEAEKARQRAEAEALEKGRSVDRIRGELVTQSAAVSEAKSLRDQAEVTGHAQLRTALKKSSKEKADLMRQLDEAVSTRRRLEGDAEQAATELRTARSAQAKLEVELSRERQRAADVARAADTERRARENLESENRVIRAELQKLLTEKTTAPTKTGVATSSDAAGRVEGRVLEPALKPSSDTRAVTTRVASAEAEVPAAKRARRGEPVGEAVTGAVADLRVEEDGDGSRVVVETDGRLQHRFQRALPGRWILDLHGARLPRAFERTLDASELPGGLISVSAFTRREGSVRLVIKVRHGAVPSLRVSPDRYFISVPPPDRRPSSAATIAVRQTAAIPTTEARRLLFGDITTAGPVASSGFGTERSLLAAVTGQTTRARRAGGGGPREDIRVNLALEEADLHRVLRLISDVVKLNFVVSDEVAGRVSILLKDVPWRTALDLILRSKGFGYVQKGNILRVAPLKALDEERKSLEEAQTRVKVERPPQVEIIPVSYAEPGQLQAQIKDVLTPKGTVAIDTRTNSLIVKDQVENLNRARRVVEFLDTQTPQILIEARIVEASTNFTRDFGIQWGGDISFSHSTGNPTGLSFPSRLGIAGGSGAAPTEGLLFGTPNYIVNLPVSAGLGAGGGIGISMGSLGGIANLHLRLTAAEENGTARIISAPKITTLDNQAATISQGVSIPYFSVGAAGASVSLTNAALSLSVTPHVTADGGIRMQVSVTKNEPDFNTRGGGGNPAMNTRSANTNIWVRDGDTTVIAGIFTRNTGLSYKEIPVLAKIPILGWLFKNRTEKDIRQELLVFITPRIINRPATIPGGQGGSASGR